MNIVFPSIFTDVPLMTNTVSEIVAQNNGCEYASRSRSTALNKGIESFIDTFTFLLVVNSRFCT